MAESQSSGLDIGKGSFQAKLVERPDGSRLLIPQTDIAAYPVSMTDWLAHWSQKTPDRVFLGQRDTADKWLTVTYAEALRRVRSIGAALTGQSLSSERPIAILSGNSIDHQLVALAAMYVGIPYAPISPSYSIAEGGLDKLRHVLRLLTPGMVCAFSAKGGEFSRAFGLQELDGARVVTDLEDLGTTGNPLAADAARAAVTADTIAKFLLTSGSTGTPKAVITTQRMLTSNQVMIHQAMPFLSEEPPVLIDWLPWNHVFGGSHNVGIALMHGGSFYIDDGRPTRKGIEQTVRNLRELAPTVYFNVPKGFEALVSFLREDLGLRRSFFSRLRANFVAGAGISQNTWDELHELAVTTTGHPVPMLTGLGATETAPAVTFATLTERSSGSVGLPAAGTVIKLAPLDDKWELRVKGPNVTPGYWRQPDLTAAGFDEERFYRLGDAARLATAADPIEGLIFDGRLAEDFKLSSGTWVSVGPLRARLLEAFAPLVQDVVITGLNRDEICVLLFLDNEGCCRTLVDLPPMSQLRELIRHESVRGEIGRRLTAFARTHGASSMRVERALLMLSPPSSAHSEITDKGTLNQRAILKHRKTEVESLYAEPPPPEVIVIAKES